MSTVMVASIAGALAAFSVEWLFKPRLEVRADTLRARRDVMLVLRYCLQLAPALRERETWERAPAEKERRASLILDEARKLEALLPRTVRKGWIHWRWPEVASAVSRLSGYIQGRLLLSRTAISDLPTAIEAVADPLVERDGTSRLFWRRRRALLEKAIRAAAALGTPDVNSAQ